MPIDDHGFGDVSPGTDSSAERLSTAIWAAGMFASCATMISASAIWMQLKHYRKPLLQRYVVRILWMVPIFAISSWVSLASLKMAFYIDALRDIYEAFVIYCFFGLLVSYLGGERSLITMLHGRPYTKHLFPVSLWYREVDVGDPYSFLFIKRGVLQYVYVKPVLAAVTMLLKSNGAYHEGSISLRSGYFWVSFFYNLSVCLSLYCLGIFFMATQGDLEEFRPIPKFLCVKAVIFFSFWQGLAISVLVATGIMSNTSPEIAVAIQDFLICLEMVFASLGHWYAFSHQDYTDMDIQSSRMPVYYAVRDACGIQDIVQDSLDTLRGTRFTYRTFEPSEGLATVGMSRSSRTLAGLRYSQGGTSKYWLPETYNEANGPVSGRHSPYAQDQNTAQQQREVERPPSLLFPDVDGKDDDGLEELYDSSRKHEFGDYNFPVIDVYDPRHALSEGKHAHRGSKKSKKRRTSNTPPHEDVSQGKSERSVRRKKGWGASLLSSSPPQHQPIAAPSSTSPSSTSPSSTSPSSISPSVAREGCVDNVNGYIPEPKPLKTKKSFLIDEAERTHPFDCGDQPIKF